MICIGPLYYRYKKHPLHSKEDQCFNHIKRALTRILVANQSSLWCTLQISLEFYVVPRQKLTGCLEESFRYQLHHKQDLGERRNDNGFLRS